MSQSPKEPDSRPAYYRRTTTQIQLPESQGRPVAATQSGSAVEKIERVGSGFNVKPMLWGLAIAVGVCLLGIPFLPKDRAGNKAEEEQSLASEVPEREVVQEYDLLSGGLAAWDSWLGMPHESIVLSDEQTGGMRSKLGLNNDPLGVFSVTKEDAKQILRVSGEVNGGLISKQEFSNYHLSLSFRWGEKSWPWSQSKIKDSGVLVHCSGEPGDVMGEWMRSLEYQIKDWAYGGLWLLDTRATIPVRRTPEHRGQPVPRFQKGLRAEVISRNVYGQTAGTIKDEWNQIDIYTRDDTTVFVLNGEVSVVALNTEMRDQGEIVPLTKGKIFLQSAGTEIYFRDIKLRQIDGFPKSLQDEIVQAKSGKGEETRLTSTAGTGRIEFQ